MKSIIKNNSTMLFGLIAFMLIGLSACEEEMTVETVALEDYKSELGLLVNTEIEVVQNTTRGYNIGEIYANDSVFGVITGDYMDSLLVAEGIIAKPDVTFEELYYANFAITTVGRRFNGEVFIADKRALNDLIGVCDTLRVHTPVGTASGEAPILADSLFAIAISQGKIVRDDGANGEFGTAYKRIQRQVDAQLDFLNADFTIYKDAIN